MCRSAGCYAASQSYDGKEVQMAWNSRNVSVTTLLCVIARTVELLQNYVHMLQFALTDSLVDSYWSVIHCLYLYSTLMTIVLSQVL